MKPDPGLPNLTPEEHLELDRLRNRYNELMTISTLEEAAKARDELQRVRARIRELTEKGGRPQRLQGELPAATLELDRLGVARGFSPRREEIWRSLS